MLIPSLKIWPRCCGMRDTGDYPCVTIFESWHQRTDGDMLSVHHISIYNRKNGKEAVKALYFKGFGVVAIFLKPCKVSFFGVLGNGCDSIMCFLPWQA